MRNKNSKLYKKNTIIFIILFTVIIAVCCVYAFKGQDNWSSERYSSTSDGQLMIQDDMDIELQFEIAEDHFQGISLRLSSPVPIFENEMLEFVMTDRETGERIAEYQMPLSHEVYQSQTFARLPCEDSKGKKVSVHIIGTDIQNNPYFDVSDNYKKDVRMYVDGAALDKVLVFNANYMTHSAINYQWFVKCAVLSLILLMILLWPRESETVKDSDSKPGKISRWRSLGKWVEGAVKKYKKGLFFTGLSLLYIFLAAFVYERYIEDVMDKKKTKSIVEAGEETAPLVMDHNTKYWEMHYGMKNNEFSTLFFHATISNADKEAKLHLKVYDDKENVCYHDSCIPMEEIGNQGSDWWKVFMDKVYENSDDEGIVVYIEPINFGNTVLKFKAGLADNNNYMYCDGGRISLVPAFKAVYRDNDYLRTLFLLFAVIVYGFLILIYYLFVIKKNDAERVFIPVTLFLGVLYMLLIPIYSVPDEYTHIDTAYIISNRILGIEEYGLSGYEYKRTVDIETEEAPKYYVTLSDYRRLYTDFFDRTDDQSLTVCAVKNALSNANVFCYLPAAIGITLGRILGLGTIPMLLLGRLMSLLMYTLLVYLAIKKLPGGKNIALIYATTPIALQEAASFAYDGVINGVAIIFVAYCLYFAYDKGRKNIWDVAVLVSSLFFMGGIKGGVYVPICFLVLLIPFEQKWKLKKYWGYCLALMLCIIVSFLQNNIIGLINRIFLPPQNSINPFTGKEMYTFGYLAEHPFKLISLYVDTFFTKTSQYIYEFFGGKMGSLSNIQMPWMYVLTFIILFLIVISSDNFRVKVSGKFSIVWTSLLACASIIVIALSMLVANTATTHDVIIGVQGRYFIPCVFPLLILLNYSMKKKYNMKLEKINFIYYLIHIALLFNVIMICVA